MLHSVVCTCRSSLGIASRATAHCVEVEMGHGDISRGWIYLLLIVRTRNRPRRQGRGRLPSDRSKIDRSFKVVGTKSMQFNDQDQSWLIIMFPDMQKIGEKTTRNARNECCNRRPRNPSGQALSIVTYYSTRLARRIEVSKTNEDAK